MSRTILGLAVTAALILGVVAGAYADEQTIWQIGQFDNSYAEFAVAGRFDAYPQAFPGGVSFRPGGDDPAKKWPFIHPGPDDAWAGGKVHPYIIVFDLLDQPSGVCALTIDFISTHGQNPPIYEVSINGTKGSVTLPKGTSDAALTDASEGKEHVLSLPFAASLLKKGPNQITLTGIGGSWALYDALRLTNDPDASLPPVEIKNVDIVPTPRVIRENGKMRRVVMLTARLSSGMTPATFTLKTDAGSRQYAAASDIDGLTQTEALVNDAPNSIPLKVTIASDQAAMSASVDLRPTRHWRIYVLPASHVDIGYTDYQERVVDVHNNNITRALELCARYPGFRWNTETAWVENNYLSMTPKERKAEFIRRAKEGRIGCQAMYGNMLTGLCSHEALIRDLYYAHGAAERYGIPFDMAVMCDVPTFVWTLPSVLAGSGIRYFAAGLNYFRDDISKRPVNKPFYWEGPDGGRVLTWMSPGYAWGWQLGLTMGVEAAAPKIDNFIRQFDRSDYACDAVLAYGAMSDNRPLDDTFASTVEEWNKRYVSPKIVLCRGPEFFHDVEKNHRGDIPVISGDLGVCWEDGAASSAMEAALARRAQETLQTAEKLDVLATIISKPASAKSQFDAAWRNAILWDEHTWGAASSISAPEGDQTLHQWKIKSAFATDLARQADEILKQGVGALARAVKASEPSVVVYNPLSWPTPGLVETKTADGRTITFRAEDVPPLGYRLYSSKDLPSLPASHATYDPQSLTLSNRFYTLQVDPATGAVKSLRDNELNRELLDATAPYEMNEYVYFAEAGGENAEDVTHAEGPAAVRVAVEDRPAGKALIIRTSAHNTPELTSEIVLRDDEKRVDITNTINKTETLDKESCYFAFPFKLDKPRFRVELPDGVLRPDTQTMPGACMEWYCSQDFIAAEDDNCAVTWTAVDSPLATLSTINSHFGGHSAHTLDKGYLYAYVFTNLWFTNYKASQGGEMVFRFSLTSARKYDPVSAARFGQSVRNPLIATTVEPSAGASPPNGGFSLCSLSPDSVEIQAMKQAESGEGIVIRLRELSGHATRATITFAPGVFKDAVLCNLVEDPQSKIEIIGDKATVPLAANGLATLRVTPTGNH